MSTEAVLPEVASAPSAPARMRDLSTGRRDLLNISPKDIFIDPSHNPRVYTLAENREHLDILKKSIAEIGVQQPLWVRWENATKQAILVDGECRLRACLELIAEGHPIEAIPCFQVQAGNEVERLMLALTANSGKPLSQWEAGEGYRKLQRFGWAIDKIAAQCSVSKNYVTTALELNEAPEAVKEELSAGTITPAAAVSIVREHGSDAGKVVKERVQAAKASGGVVKRERVTSLPGASTGGSEAEALRIARKIIKEITKEEWDTAEDLWIGISRRNLAGLKAALGMA